MFAHINHLILKVTRDCNLRCAYCYEKDKDHHKGEIIDFQVIKDVTSRLIFDRKKAENTRPILITFHGGEPTKIGKENLFKYFDYMSSALTKNDIPYRLSIQTNLTLIDEETAIILNKFNVSVGFSFDGFKGNSLRTKEHDDDFYIDTLSVLKKYNVSFSPLIIANTENKDKIQDTLSFLEKEMHIADVKINYSEDVLTEKTSESDNFELTGKEFFESVWKRQIENKNAILDRHLKIYLERFMLDLFLEGELNLSGNCYIKYCGAILKVITVTPDGTVHKCGRYSEPFEESIVGSIYDKEFLDLKTYLQYVKFTKIKNDVLKQNNCDSCRARNICDRGCLAFYFSKYKKWGIRRDLVCDSYLNFYDYLHKNKHKIIKKLMKNNEIVLSKNGFISTKQKKVKGYIIKETDENIIVRRKRWI